MLESEVEAKLRKAVQGAGALCLKFESPAFTGVPDRLVLMPGGHVLFVETKQPGKTERRRQEVVQAMLRKMGFAVFSAVQSAGQIEMIVDEIRRLSPQKPSEAILTPARPIQTEVLDDLRMEEREVRRQ